MHSPQGLRRVPCGTRVLSSGRSPDANGPAHDVTAPAVWVDPAPLAVNPRRERQRAVLATPPRTQTRRRTMLALSHPLPPRRPPHTLPRDVSTPRKRRSPLHAGGRRPLSTPGAVPRGHRLGQGDGRHCRRPGVPLRARLE